MALLTKEDEQQSYALTAFAFWRNMAVYFCVFSVVGHWLEIPYCLFMDQFGIVDEDTLVFADPFYPFLVYGIGALVCTLLLVPLKTYLVERFSSLPRAGIAFFVITVLVCMIMELGMGLLLNQPNAAGEYPLWDNSQLPLNIFGQAWLVNDLVLGVVAMLYTWLFYPLLQRGMAKLPFRVANLLAAVVVVGFIVLCIVKFS